MLDLLHGAPPPRPQLLGHLRARFEHLEPPLRPVAEGVLAAESVIDWVALEPLGRAVIVLVDESGRDLELLGRALAQRAWLAPRLRDWVQLAPELGIRPEAGVGAMLLSPAFGAEALAAVAALGAEAPALVRYRCLRNSTGLHVLLEPLLPARRDAVVRPPGAPRAPSAFRTGLNERDLELTTAELREFE